MKQRISGLEGFILLLVGQSISLLGSGLTGFALDIWVFLETGSVTLFGFIAVLGVLPNIIISPFAGAIVDRSDRKKVMIISDSVVALCTLALAYLLFTEQLAVFHVGIITTIMSAAGAFQRPAYVATTPLLVPKRHYERINGIAAMIGAAAQILAPTMAAFLILAIDLWGILVVDFVTYLIALVIIWQIHIPRPKATAAGQTEKKSLWQEVVHGWRYLTTRAGLFALMIFSTLSNFIVGVLVTLMTPMALSLYDARVLGLALSSGGIGVLAGGLLMTFWRGPKKRIWGILIVHFLGGLAVLVAGLEPVPTVFYIVAFFFFMGIPITDGLASAIWYSKTAPDVLGRTRAVRQAFSWSLLPVSYLLSGVLADRVFEPLFAENGAWSGTFMGELIGIGPGFGIAFLFALTGIVAMIQGMVGFLYPRLRHIEEELPDAVTESPEEMVEPSEGSNEPMVENVRFGMTRSFRIALIGLTAVVLVLILSGVFISVLTVRRPFPKTEGIVALPGVKESVNIYRDEYGIPHIYANSVEDMFFAQGYVHAQDRFWQMEVQRRVAQGRTAELYGEFTLDVDILARNIGWNRIGSATWAMYQESSPETVAALEAYSAGINAYLDENRDNFSLNMTIWEVIDEPWEIEPWTPEDTLMLGVALDWGFGGGMYREQERAILRQTLGESAETDLWPYYSDDRPYILTNPIAEEGSNNLVLPENTVLSPNLNFIGATQNSPFGIGLHPFAGSNSWVVSGKHTDTGLPMLANDPHLDLEIPSRWYEVALHGPGWDVVGFSFAGVPGVVIGRNNHITWGLTNARVDTQDLFIEKINPVNPLQYEFEGEWHDMTVITEVIGVADIGDYVLDVRQTHHGVIVTDADERLDQVLALSWASSEPSRVMQAILELNQASNYAEFRDAMRIWDTLSQNIIYADVEGNIAYQLPGRIPKRRNGDGSLPVPGWTGEYEWDGWIPFEELPSLLNPVSGYIITANNAIVDENHPYVISREWGSGDRAARIQEMLEITLAENGQITINDFARVQLDAKSLLAADYVPLLLDLSSDDERVIAALEQLRNWDYQENRESVATTIFEIFYMHLANAVVGDELGAIQDVYLFDGNTQRIFFHNLSQQPDALWWDNVNTDSVETRDEILMQALTETITWLEKTIGQNMDQWRWGTLHTITFENVPLGRFGIVSLEFILNRGPFPVDGGNSVINAIDWDWEDPARSTGGVTFRLLVDLANIDGSQAIHATGQSGHPYHPNYADMIELWQNGEYHQVAFSREAALNSSVEHLVLINPDSGDE